MARSPQSLLGQDSHLLQNPAIVPQRNIGWCPGNGDGRLVTRSSLLFGRFNSLKKEIIPVTGTLPYFLWTKKAGRQHDQPQWSSPATRPTSFPCSRLAPSSRRYRTAVSPPLCYRTQVSVCVDEVPSAFHLSVTRGVASHSGLGLWHEKKDAQVPTRALVGGDASALLLFRVYPRLAE